MSVHYEIMIPALQPVLQNMDDYDRIADKHLLVAMEKSTTTIVSAVRPKVPVGVSGALRKSIGSEITQEGPGSITGRVGSTLRDEVYPLVMEFGRTPGAAGPPWQALLRWVHVKRITGVYSTKTHRRMGGKTSQQSEDEAAARMIARAIHRRGIKGRHFMKTGWENSREKVRRFFQAALRLIAEELTNGG